MSSALKIQQNKKSDSAQEVIFRKISELVGKHSGIFLNNKKNYLIENRLRKRLEVLGLGSFENYLKIIETDPEELSICIECITTHKTEWFREIIHFQWLKSELPQLVEPGNPLCIWSAACSSGEEVYSLLFFLLKQGLNHNHIRILGTDISRPILNKALTLPESPEFAEQMQSLLSRVEKPDFVKKELDLALEKSIKIRQYNLTEGSSSMQMKFHVIFLRNVLIYFERQVVIEVCRRLIRQLHPGGFLVIGLSETLNGDIPELVFLKNSVYQYRPGDSK